MELAARCYPCTRCHQQVIICPICDRGNRYCGPACSAAARAESLRSAGRRYQSSQCGKHKHAARQQSYRQRWMKKVTHQGSPPSSFRDLLPEKTRTPPIQAPSPAGAQVHCHFCGCLCAPLVRTDFFRGRQRLYSFSDRMASSPGADLHHAIVFANVNDQKSNRRLP